MPQNIFEVIRKWTNAEGKVVYKDKWKKIDHPELKKFIGLIILIGVYKSKHENVTQLWSQEDGRPIFNKIMSRGRFQQILQVLRFDDASARRRKRSDDRLEPIREVFEMWNQNLQDGYVPSSCMTVDEQLVTFRGRCPFRVYIPSKPGKYGIKIWAICDSETSYAWKMQIYTGKDPVKGREQNQGSRVVEDRVKELENTGRYITCDNFFTSLGLARKLLSKKTTSVGTIRKNRVELPSAFTNGKEREINSTIFGFQKDSMILSYCPKKNYVVTLMSTMHSQPSIDSKSSKKKPEVITYYNKTKGGVDTLDKMVRTYSCKRMTRRLPMVIFCNMIDISAVNAFIIAKQLHLQSFKDKRRQFLIQLGKELAGVNAKQEHDRQSSSSADISQPNKKRRPSSSSSDIPQPKKKGRCSLCGPKKDRKTRTTCKNCNIHVCQEHSNVVCIHCHKEL